MDSELDVLSTPVTDMAWYLTALALGMSAWVFLIILARAWRGQACVAWQPQQPVEWNGRDVCVVACCYVVFPIFAQTVLSKPIIMLEQLAVSAASMVAATVCAVGYLRAQGASWQSLGVRLGRPCSDLQLGLAGLALIVAPLLTLAALLDKVVPYHHAIVDFLTSRRDPLALSVVVVSAVVVAPIAEEFLFRRVLQGWLEKRFNKIGSLQDGNQTAVVLSALAFAFAHLGQGLAWVPLIFFGLVVGYLARQTGSIVAGSILHALFNALSVLLVVVQTAPAATGGE